MALQHISWLGEGWGCAVWERGDRQEDGGSTQEPPHAARGLAGERLNALL